MSDALDGVPDHWNVVTLGQIGRFVKGRGGNKEDETEAGVPCVRYGDLYTRHRFFITETRSFIAPERAVDYTLSTAGDVLFAGSGETIEEIGKSAVNLVDAEIRVGGDVILLRPSRTVNFRFLGYACEADYVVLQKSRMGKGVTVMHIYPQALRRVRLAMPPLDEQVAIVRYLDYVDSRIQRLIAAKERLIDLLEEEKEAIIRRFTTWGIDPQTRFEPSDVDWLRHIPSDWETSELRHLGRVVGGMTPSMDVPSYWDGDVPWVSPKDMKTPVITRSNMHVTEAAVEATGLKVIPPGSVLLVVRGMILARHVPIAISAVDVTLNQDMKAIVPASRVTGEYLALVLRSAQESLRAMIDEAGHGTRRLPTELWTRLIMPVPSLPEQAQIVATTNKAKLASEGAQSVASRQIALLHEYRTRLISDVVTGKLDVRDAAAKLPADPDDDVPELDETLEEAVA